VTSFVAVHRTALSPDRGTCHYPSSGPMSGRSFRGSPRPGSVRPCGAVTGPLRPRSTYSSRTCRTNIGSSVAVLVRCDALGGTRCGR